MLTQEEEIDISSVLSGEILDELHEEARTRHTMGNSLFSYFCSNFPRVARQLCRDSMAELSARRGYNFFFYGDACERVIILTSGAARYIHNTEENMRASEFSAHASLHSSTCPVGETVHDNRWISEMVLWTHWVCCGWLGAVGDCQALTIDQTCFGVVVKQYEQARHVARAYAKEVVQCLQVSLPTDLFEVSVDLKVPDWQSKPKQQFTRFSLRSFGSSDG